MKGAVQNNPERIVRNKYSADVGLELASAVRHTVHVDCQKCPNTKQPAKNTS